MFKYTSSLQDVAWFQLSISSTVYRRAHNILRASLSENCSGRLLGTDLDISTICNIRDQGKWGWKSSRKCSKWKLCCELLRGKGDGNAAGAECDSDYLVAVMCSYDMCIWVVGSKNLKARHYGGSESTDFLSACGVAQHNEGHRRQTGISRGPRCKSYKLVNHDTFYKLVSEWIAYKRFL